jgi:type II secretory pathway pseudopilin PulG
MTSKYTVYKNGFTLIELLVSIVVMIAVGTIIAGIVSSSLRGTNKTNTIENIRQNGNYVLNQISKNIEYAQLLDGKNTGLSNDDGETYDVNCKDSLNPTPTPETAYDLISVQTSDNALIKYKCDVSNPLVPVLTANGTSLIDDSLVSLRSCSFKCVQSKPTEIPMIKISFSLGSKNSNKMVENSTPPVTFETSVILRNYKN